MSNPISGLQPNEAIGRTAGDRRAANNPARLPVARDYPFRRAGIDMDEITSHILFETSASPRIWEIEADALRMPEGRQ